MEVGKGDICCVMTCSGMPCTECSKSGNWRLQYNSCGSCMDLLGTALLGHVGRKLVLSLFGISCALDRVDEPEFSVSGCC